MVGSSRKRTGGAKTRLAARSSRRRIPPEYVFTRREAAPALQALRELPGAVSPPAVSASPHGGARVELRVSGDGDRALAAAAARLVRAGVEPVGLRTEAPSLDDVFLSVTGQPADLDRSAA